jgi:hypothetical protein
MNKTFLIIGIIIVVGFLIYKFGLKSSETDLKNTTRPDNINKPTTTKANDKIILIKNLKLDYLKQAINQLCNMSNQNQYIALPRLTVLDNEYVITFPYDIDFDQFCYFVNYLKYAHELSLKPDYKPEIKAWCTTKPDYAWMTDEIANKTVMIYIPDWDKDYDNVYLTTQDNLGFKMGFALGEEHKKMDNPVLQFEKMPNDLDLNNKETIDFE